MLAFAGETDFAYPIMLQMANAVNCYDRSATRQLSLTDLKGHLVRVANDMLRQEADVARGASHAPQVSFLIAGYCWKYRKFQIWTIEYEPQLKRFVHRVTPNWRGAQHQLKRLAIVGDHLDETREVLLHILQQRGTLSKGGFNMEPFDALLAMIDDSRFASIGGNAQLVKVYRSIKTVPFVIERNGSKSLFGRALLDYEAPDRFPTVAVRPTDPSQ